MDGLQNKTENRKVGVRVSVSEADGIALEEALTIRNGEGENPYLSARRKWNSEVDKAFSAARTWQVVGIVGLLTAMGAIAGIVYIGSQSKFVPYIIEVDKLGQAAAVRPADRASVADPRVLHACLASFIASARGVTPDRALQGEAIYRAYAMVGAKDPAAAKIREWWNEDKKQDPYSRAATEEVNVQIVSVLPTVSDKAWEVTWTETTRDRDDNLKGPAEHWKAMLTIYTAPLSAGATEQQIFRNPMGVYVKDFNWTRLN
jgi:type IV secretory pathway TrbF-like protein